ncbi:ACP phosphodiesterase [Bacteroidota bacterium]
MNFLAHIYLSGDVDEVKIGNFIGDYVKGSAFHIYPENIRKGILLHRFIDSFTDKSTHTIDAKQLFAPKYRKYSGIVVDIIYDHFLASDWSKYSFVPFEEFIADFHEILIRNNDMLPKEVQNFIPKLIENERLYSYREIGGIWSVLKTMPKYTSLPDHTDFAIETLKNNYEFLKRNFFLFFTDIIYYIKTVHNIDIKGI